MLEADLSDYTRPEYSVIESVSCPTGPEYSVIKSVSFPTGPEYSVIESVFFNHLIYFFAYSQNA
jgi:hypothetical protein